MRRLYSVLDKKAQSFGPVMSYSHEAVAVREFGLAVADKESMLSKYPDDFVLCEIGQFHPDDATAPVRSVPVKEVVSAIALVQASAAAEAGQLSLLKEA